MHLVEPGNACQFGLSGIASDEHLYPGPLGRGNMDKIPGSSPRLLCVACAQFVTPFQKIRQAVDSQLEPEGSLTGAVSLPCNRSVFPGNPPEIVSQTGLSLLSSPDAVVLRQPRSQTKSNTLKVSLREVFHAQISAHHAATLALIVSRTSRVLMSFSSGVPGKPDGSRKLQCRRVVTPGKIGQRSALVSSHTVMT